MRNKKLETKLSRIPVLSRYRKVLPSGRVIEIDVGRLRYPTKLCARVCKRHRHQDGSCTRRPHDHGKCECSVIGPEHGHKFGS